MLDGRHDTADTHLGYSAQKPTNGWLHAGLDAGVWGGVADLGVVPLDAVSVAKLASLVGPAGELFATYRLPQIDPSSTNPQAALDAWDAARRDFDNRQAACGLNTPHARAAQARVGHTYAARIVRWEQVDLLAAVHVAALDDLGAIVAWRVLEARPLPVQR